MEISKCDKSRLSPPSRGSSLFTSTALSECHVNWTTPSDISHVPICDSSCFLNVVKLGGQGPLTYTASESPKEERS